VKKRTSSKVAGTTRDYHPFPKYLQIRDVILRWLATQQVGERLPTEMALSDQFGVSRETIRKSLTRLEQNGIIRRRQRAGTFLAKRPAMNADLRLTGPIEEFKDLGTATTAKLVSQQAVRAPADVAGALGLVEGDQVYEFKRIRVLGGEPLLLLDAYFPPAIGRKIARVDLHAAGGIPADRRGRGAGRAGEATARDAGGAGADGEAAIRRFARQSCCLLPRAFPIRSVFLHDQAAPRPAALICSQIACRLRGACYRRNLLKRRREK
jgi:GntR family transcriptional regulator